MLNKTKILWGVVLSLFFPLAASALYCGTTYVYEWAGICDDPCGIGRERGTLKTTLPVCHTYGEGDGRYRVCACETRTSIVSRSCLGDICSGSLEYSNATIGSNGAIHVFKTTKRNFTAGEAVPIFWLGTYYNCNNASVLAGVRVRTTNNYPKTVFYGYMEGGGSRGEGDDSLRIIYTGSTALTAPSIAGSHYIEISTLSDRGIWSSWTRAIRYDVTVPCTSDCSCAANTCVGSTCSDGCGGTCAGTKVSTTWTPSASSYCSGYTLTQTGSQCSDTRTTTGTKTCTSSYCKSTGTPYSYCRNNDVYGIYNYWNSSGCSGTSCLGSWIYNSCGNFKQEECGSSSCDTSGTEHEYCQDGDVWVKYDGVERGCASADCYSNNVYCGHQLKETCNADCNCESTDTDQAECVAKSALWTEE